MFVFLKSAPIAVAVSVLLSLGVSAKDLKNVPDVVTSTAKELSGKLTDVLESEHGKTYIVKSTNGKTYRIVIVDIQAKPERVWKVLNDYENTHKVFGFIHKLKVAEQRSDGTKIVEQVLKPTGMPGQFNNVMEVKEEVNKRQQWHRVGGSCKEVDAEWKLDPNPDGKSTTVTYITSVDCGFFFPQAVINGQAKVDLPRAVAGLKKASEAVR